MVLIWKVMLLFAHYSKVYLSADLISSNTTY